MSSSEASARGKRVLVVDDDAAIRQMIAFALVRHGCQVVEAEDAKDALASISRHRPGLAIIDWMLPGMSGVALTGLIKRDPALSHIGVIILTARAAECDKVQGLEAGADDYVTKPFSTRELLARINAVSRGMTRKRAAEPVRVNALVLDPDSQRVSVGDSIVPLGPVEFRLLSFLMNHPERVHSRTQLLDRVWGTHTKRDQRTVDVEISRLRQVLEGFNCDLYIQTVHGAGYRFSTRTN